MSKAGNKSGEEKRAVVSGEVGRGGERRREGRKEVRNGDEM